MSAFEIDKENAPMGGNSLMLFSPPAKVEKASKAATKAQQLASLPSLVTARFQKTMHIDFGTVAVGSSSSKQFRLINPNESKSVTVSVDKVATDKGFTIILGNSDTIEIAGGGNAIGTVMWNPTSDMSVSSTATLKLNDNSPMQVTMRGIAGSGQASTAPAEKVDFATKRKALAAIADVNNRDNENSIRRQFKPVVPAAAAKQTSTTNVKRMYDDKWADKQIESFTEWMNFTFSQTGAPESDENVDSNRAGAGLRLLMQRRQEAQIRQRAMLIFHSSEVAVPLFALGEEICEGRLVVRDDRDVHADLGLKEMLLGVLFSYELPWLRLGLEVVFGQIISFRSSSTDVPCVSGCAKWTKLLKSFILGHMFADAGIHSKPKYSKDKLLYTKNQELLKEELRAHLVQKFLALVLVIDNAREQRLLSLSTMFLKTSTVKSSKEVLLSFCKEFLRGEGDFVRHLGLMGYSVSFSQTYTDEYDYSVKNLAVDLRDGVRLTRLVEILMRSTDLSSQLRVPAVSITQKVHNVKLATDAIFTSKAEVGPDPRAIVDGNRDMTLILLWKLMFNFELKMLIDPARVRREAALIRQNQTWRRSVYTASEAADFAVAVPIVDAYGRVTYPTTLAPAETETGSQDDCAVASALLEWCDAVAGQYGVPVYNFTSCLADGRALCLLVNYYHPTMLPAKAIRRTTQNIAAAFASNTVLDTYTESCIDIPKQEMRRAIDSERKNFITLKRACADIGGIPTMLTSHDSNNQPEAKSMTIFLGYLFSRLIESSEQVNAAIRIQRAYRRCAPQLRRTMRLETRKPKQRVPVRATRKEVDNVVTDVCVTVAMSTHHAANIIKRLVQTFYQRRCYLRFLETRAADEELKQEEEARWAQFMVDQQAQEEREAQEAADYRAQQAADEAVRLLAEEQERAYALEQERYLREEAVEERRRLMEMHEETAKLALEEAENARAEVEAAEEERERALQEADDARAEAEAEAEQRAALEERLAEYEEAQEEADLQTKHLELVRLHLEEEVAAGRMTQAALLAQLELEQTSKITAEAEARARYDELVAANAQLAQEMLAAAQASAQQKEAEAIRVAQERMDAAVQAEKAAREAAEVLTATMAEQVAQYEQRVRELEESRVAEIAAAKEAERLRVEAETRLAAELAERVEEARLTAEENARRKVEEEGLIAAAAVQAERDARAAIEAQMKSEAAARQAVEAQLLALESAQAAAEAERARIAEETRLMNMMRNSACTTIQTAWRRAHAMALYFNTLNFAVRLQSMVRGNRARKYHAKLRLCTLFVQSNWRQRRMQNLLNKCNAAATVVQSKWRAYSARAAYVAYALDMSVQIAASTQHAEAVKLRRSAIEESSARVVAKWFKAHLMIRRVRQLVRGFRRLQACFRSASIRRRLAEEVNVVRIRIKLADQRARADPNLALGNQTQASLEVLQSGKMISHLLKACQTLELSTMVSAKCCQAFTQAQASSVLFGLIRSCNRSTPHQEILRHALVVLVNVARHRDLAASVAQNADSTDVLVDLMQMFRDKKPIFCLSCELLGRLAAASDATKNTCNSSDYRKRLDGILNIIERKHRLDARVKSIGAKTALEFVGSPKGKGKYLSDMEPIHGIQHLFFVLEAK